MLSIVPYDNAIPAAPRNRPVERPIPGAKSERCWGRWAASNGRFTVSVHLAVSKISAVMLAIAARPNPRSGCAELSKRNSPQLHATAHGSHPCLLPARPRAAQVFHAECIHFGYVVLWTQLRLGRYCLFVCTALISKVGECSELRGGGVRGLF
jgi:hypothetical protein